MSETEPNPETCAPPRKNPPDAVEPADRPRSRPTAPDVEAFGTGQPAPDIEAFGRASKPPEYEAFGLGRKPPAREHPPQKDPSRPTPPPDSPPRFPR